MGLIVFVEFPNYRKAEFWFKKTLEMLNLADSIVVHKSIPYRITFNSFELWFVDGHDYEIRRLGKHNVKHMYSYDYASIVDKVERSSHINSYEELPELKQLRDKIMQTLL